MKNNHEYYEMLISRYKDNDLDANEIFEMEKHLASCKSCQKFKDEVNSMSSILLGKSNIKIDKKPVSIFNKKRVIASISSIAAALLVFGAVSTIYNKNNITSSPNDNSKLIAADLNNNSITTTSSDDYNTQEDYAPLSSYFTYSDIDAENDSLDNNDSEISIMSAYIYYMGK
ncbi:zf-HC2 domain-containing protein [Brachyspira hampsonii]|uniref:zf-HC2 domain-containing protein n=1 Tax=Brachyspira hampsonii TaxID=1287055 RepID=UPI001C6759AE|nr:zf-HC2 domain-containing protein [Brachyspira hampsonii]MBW5389205.1 zf-HC2 domain-containing protein [Brachyspira hampsonii]